MVKSLSVSQRRLGVVVNYVSLLAVIGWVYLMEATSGGPINLAIVAAPALVLLVTWYRYFMATGLWRLSHTRLDRLDERQYVVIHGALRTAYSVFAILSLLVLLWKSLIPGEDPNLIIAFGGLLYLAHTLPAAALAWTEKEV